MITFTQESIVDLYLERRDLIEDHYEEAPFYEDIPVQPQLDFYQQLDDQGNYFLLVARIDGEVVGYISYVICPLIQFDDQIIADMELIYTAPEARGTGIGTQLLEEAEKLLVDNYGATVASIRSKSDSSIRGFAELMGYTEKEVMFTKRIGDL